MTNRAIPSAALEAAVTVYISAARPVGLAEIEAILEAAAPYMQPAPSPDVAEGNRQHLAAFREWKPGDPVE